MKKESIYLAAVIVALLFITSSCGPSRHIAADEATNTWNYEISLIGVGTNGSTIVQVTAYSRSKAQAVFQAKKNAIHGLIFKGVQSSTTAPSQPPLCSDPSLENIKSDFFAKFFQSEWNIPGGVFMKYVISSNDAQAMIVKMRRTWKVTINVTINKDLLRNDLEKAGITKSINYIF